MLRTYAFIEKFIRVSCHWRVSCWTSWQHCRLAQRQTSFHLYFSRAWHRVGAQLNVCWSSVWSVSVPENLDSTEAPGVAWALLSSPVLGTCWVSETTRGALHAVTAHSPSSRRQLRKLFTDECRASINRNASSVNISWVFFFFFFFFTINPLGTQLEIQAILPVWLKTNETHIPSTQTLLYLQPFTPSAGISVICTWAGLTRPVCSLYSEKCRSNVAWLNISWFRKLNNQLSLVDYLLCAGTMSGFSLCCL